MTPTSEHWLHVRFWYGDGAGVGGTEIVVAIVVVSLVDVVVGTVVAVGAGVGAIVELQ